MPGGSEVKSLNERLSKVRDASFVNISRRSKANLLPARSKWVSDVIVLKMLGDCKVKYLL